MLEGEPQPAFDFNRTPAACTVSGRENLARNSQIFLPCIFAGRDSAESQAKMNGLLLRPYPSFLQIIEDLSLR
jgi:hypothetical protein